VGDPVTLSGGAASQADSNRAQDANNCRQPAAVKAADRRGWAGHGHDMRSWHVASFRSAQNPSGCAVAAATEKAAAAETASLFR